MKAKNMMLVLVLLFTGVAGNSIQAQEALNALVKKCESMEKVDINVIYNRNKETKKVEKCIKSIGFTDPQLMNEFLAAFEKEKENAYQVIDNKVNGKMMPSFYRFSVGKSEISYSFTASKNGRVDITYIEDLR